MKKYFNFTILLAVFMTLCAGFSSCSDDDDDDSSDSLVGVWTFVNITADIQNPTNQEAVERERDDIGLITVFMQGSSIEFKTDKTFSATIMGKIATGSYTQDGDHIITTLHDETTESDEDETLTLWSPDSFVSLKNGVLTFVTDNLNKYRQQKGFTKYEVKMTFKRYVVK
jgi:hypothetical protein